MEEVNKQPNPNFEPEEEKKKDTTIKNIIPSITNDKKKTLKIVIFLILSGYLVYSVFSSTPSDKKPRPQMQQPTIAKIEKNPSDATIKIDKDAKKEEVEIQSFADLQQKPIKTQIKIPEFSMEEEKKEDETPAKKEFGSGLGKALESEGLIRKDKLEPQKEKEGENSVEKILSSMKTGKSSRYKEQADSTDDNYIILNDEYISKKKNAADSKHIKKFDDPETTIQSGAIISASLTQAIDSELAGTVVAMIAKDVYGQMGSSVLIPRGSKAIGAYTTTASAEETRIGIIWSKIIRPDGITITIDAYAADQLGKKGVEADIDERYGDLFQNSLMLSMLTLGTAIATEKLTGASNTVTTAVGAATTTTTPVNTAFQSIVTTANTVAKKMSEKYSSVTPKLSVPHGTEIKIIVNTDIEGIPPVHNKE